MKVHKLIAMCLRKHCSVVQKPKGQALFQNLVSYLSRHYSGKKVDLLGYIYGPNLKVFSKIQPHVVQNLYKSLSSVEHKRRYFKEC